MLMVTLYDAGSQSRIGTLSEENLSFLIEHLEEESAVDQDYYINRATLDLFESAGADPELMAMLRTALGQREDMDIRWAAAPDEQA